MKIVGLCPVRNEDWIIGLTLRAQLMWMDEVVVLAHACTDGTWRILTEIQKEVGSRLHLWDADNPEWLEMKHRQNLLEYARICGATHCGMIDADEMLTGNLLPSVRAFVEALPPGQCLGLPWIAVWRSPLAYRVDQFIRTSDCASTAFADKVGLLWHDAAGYQHHHREPYGATVPGYPAGMHALIREAGGGKFDAGGLMHFQFTDWGRILAKHALYKMNEIARWPGRMRADEIERMYNPTLSEQGLQTKPIPWEWYEPYKHLLHHLRIGPPYWQQAECAALRASGRNFNGLDLFGVA